MDSVPGTTQETRQMMMTVTLPPPVGVDRQHSFISGNLSSSSTAANPGEKDPSNRLDSSQPQQKTSGKASHQCHLCDRGYERADHLNRHLKTHENARSHKCRQCPKRFNRADLLTRHESSHSRAPATRRVDDGVRVLVACRACVASKCKCQEEKPCIRCSTKKIPCEVAPSKLRATATSLGLENRPVTPVDSVSSRSNEGMSYSEESLTDQSPTSTTSATIKIVDYMMDEASSTQTQLNCQSTYDPPAIVDVDRLSNAADGSVMAYNASQMCHQPMEQYPSGSSDFPFHQELGFIPQDSYFGQDLDFEMWEMDNAVFEPQTVTGVTSTTKQAGEDTREDPTTAALHSYKRYAAFERSTWLWNPTQSDHTLNDQTNLSFDDEGVALASTPDTPGTSMDQFTSCCIDVNMRDRILHLLFNLRLHNTPITSFPPLNFLNLVIQVYFVQSKYKVDHMIHSASFNPKTAIPELILAIISAGATAITAPSVWRMGLALQEIARHTIAELWERNNSKTRHLQALQAWVISCEIGLWSGVKRKMEIAESVCQPAIMMMRRAGVYTMGISSPDLKPTMEDSITLLESKWERFAERESFKRLALRLFIHDTQASAGFQKPPQMSFTELEFDLPLSTDLWLAESALQWRDRYLQKQWIKVPTFLEVIQNPKLLQQIETLIDAKVCAMVIIAGYWGQIWRLLEARKFYPAARAAYRLSLMTEKDELYRDLVTVVANMSLLCHNEPSVVVFGEFFLMVSHVSAEDIQRFAGKSGPAESKKASETFRNWSHSSESRMAIWHAGQVLRAARHFKPSFLREFYAVAVYYASLTLWIYGILIVSGNESFEGSISDRQFPSDASADGPNIYLNEAETEAVNTFCVSNKGTPGLVVMENDGALQFKPITSAASVLEFARNILWSNFSHSSESLPLLVDSLGNLMRELSSLAESRLSRLASETLE